MRRIIQIFSIVFFVSLSFFAFTAFKPMPYIYISESIFPYKEAGLTERQAAAHLLSRFSYGATTEQLDAVKKLGLEKWFEQQLEAKQPDDLLKQLIDGLDVTVLTNAQIVKKYPGMNKVLRMAVQDGVVNKDSVNSDPKKYRQVLLNYMQQKGMASEQELFKQFVNQKVLRAAYSKNQLQEVMTDFWFNHFNVSITKYSCALYIPTYERDVIRPNALSKFGDILLATAKSPAMLIYLDNFSSTGQKTLKTKPVVNSLAKSRLASGHSLQNIMPTNGSMMGDAFAAVSDVTIKKAGGGLNENYAREVMELHTLGVDGGYTQQDVTQAARVLTGWTLYSLGNDYSAGIIKQLDRIGRDKLEQRGFVHDGDFLFTPNRHEYGVKTVLGKKFGPNNGYGEGVELLDMLAHHQSTAKFISRKLALRFVSDHPPQTLVDKMAKTFIDSDGDIKEVLLTMVYASEFWRTSSIREKIKSPFELAISAVRSLNAQITQPYELYSWITKMGEKKYYYQAPTGFPDKAQYWINTGSLLNRMNFGLALASGRIPGVKIDLLKMNKGHEPESAQAALATYSKLIMPERNLNETIKRLTPMLNDPLLIKKVEAASAQTKPAGNSSMLLDDPMTTGRNANSTKSSEIGKGKNAYLTVDNVRGSNTMLSQVVGVIIGSPEFQRR